ncbi:thiamine pyrophosphokinase [Algoriphagus sediminis]|uniref:Thiamine pyrophosphokinase n=1 Tax=Algoriphagus sediminis TaxID=3057113 RepID=A0ABT7YD00_9BACT|nr:thiamine pyrophosphokinase [Algoriphagus sediminis]MDN3204270.1 thiamine pyrophosphokinase [Algoriphagus sediminis]
MSSHHFVKEQQEPAVFILDTVGVSFDSIGPMLEWVPTVIATEKSLEKVISWGVKVDVLIATEKFQNVNKNLLNEQSPIIFLQSESENFLSDGIKYLLATDHFAAHLVGYDHSKFLELNSLLDKINLTIIDQNWKYYPVRHKKLSKWFRESTLRFLAKDDLPIQISNESGVTIVPNLYLTQFEVPEGTTALEAKEVFWIGEELKASK